MKLTNRTPRRVAAIASVIGAAILIPAVALAAPGRSAHTAAATPKCAAADLRPWLGVPGEGAAGHTFYQLEISNVSQHACSLRGFPGVSAVGPHGQLGSAAARNRSHPVRTVTLARGATAHVELTLTNVSGFAHGACHQTTASELKVFAPNDFKANLISFSFRACAKRGPVFLGVSTVIAGTGIPFFSR
jgi:Protein of unknown function (DUF4232)